MTWRQADAQYRDGQCSARNAPKNDANRATDAKDEKHPSEVTTALKTSFFGVMRATGMI